MIHVHVENVDQTCSAFVHLSSDQMGNKGAFITLTKDLKPNFTTFSEVVRYVVAYFHHYHYLSSFSHTLKSDPCNMLVHCFLCYHKTIAKF